MNLAETFFWMYVTFATVSATCAVAYFTAAGLRQFVIDARRGQDRRRSEIPGVMP
jgi:hypothetical protein